MEILTAMQAAKCEQMALFHDEACGLKAIVAIHSTTLGPSVGGCRMRPYATDEEAVVDALRLSRAMSYKSAMAGLPFGGGKAIILGDPASDKSESLFRSFGRFIETLQGRYITGLDLGTTVPDMDWIHLESQYVTDTTGSLGAIGNMTAEMTAYGVYLGIRASLRYVFGSESLHGRSVAVQGLGKVGYSLCRYLHTSGASLMVADVDAAKVKSAVHDFAAIAVPPMQIHQQKCDVFSPCALGGGLNEATIPQLNCRIVAGAANNQLGEQRHGDMLHQREILYAPDYVINAGGMIVTAAELGETGSTESGSSVKRSVEQIYETLSHVFHVARQTSISPSGTADAMAERIIESGRSNRP